MLMNYSHPHIFPMRTGFFVLLLFVCKVASAQTSILDVMVLDSSGYGNVRDAEVRLVVNGTAVHTNDRGWLRIYPLEAGTDTVIVTSPTLGSDTAVVKLEKDGHTEVRINLPGSCKNRVSTDVCPKCRSNRHVVGIVYGLPTNVTMKRAEKGELRLGGCMIDDCSPLYYCKEHQLEF